MSPKEKARELLNKMCREIGTYPNSLVTSVAKQCAIIAVTEMLDVLFQHHEIDYWKEVKSEIEKR